MNTNYNELKEKAHSNAVNHGFWKDRQSNEHCLMLIITEISELVEADRKSIMARKLKFEKALSYESYLSNLSIYGYDTEEKAKQYMSYDDWKRQTFNHDCFRENIKDSFEDEFADIAIRLFDLAGALGVDFDKMQPCRYYRAYDKFSFTENAFALCKGLCRNTISIERRIQFGLHYVEKWTQFLGIDLAWHINMKMQYNENRPTLHGKKY